MSLYNSRKSTSKYLETKMLFVYGLFVLVILSIIIYTVTKDGRERKEELLAIESKKEQIDKEKFELDVKRQVKYYLLFMEREEQLKELKNSLNNNKSSEVTYKNLYNAYDLERDRLIVEHQWTQLILPSLEVMECYEGSCDAFWRSKLNNDKVLNFSIIICPNNYGEEKYCGNSDEKKLVIHSYKIITNQEMDDILLSFDIFNSK